MDEASSLAVSELQKKASMVGERLKQIREKCGLSQRELARRADVTNGTLSNIEQGRVSPSIASLEKILAAIPMSLQQFFAEEVDVSPSVYRAQDLVEIHKNDANYRILPLSEIAGFGDAYIAHQIYAPGAKVTSEWMVRSGTIAGIIVSGRLDLVLDGVLHNLSVGDGFSFSIHRSHTFKNTSSEACTVVSVSFSD